MRLLATFAVLFAVWVALFTGLPALHVLGGLLLAGFWTVLMYLVTNLRR